jgi:hypothetical protein
MGEWGRSMRNAAAGGMRPQQECGRQEECDIPLGAQDAYDVQARGAYDI